MNSSSQAALGTDTIDITIVIVNYNVREFLQECLESIRRSRNALNIEVLVVDNNSHDQSVEYLRPRFAECEFIALETNLGFGKANNIGIERAKGRYVLLLNPDTILQEDTLEKMKLYMDAHPEVGISGCKVLNADLSFQMQCRRGFPSPWASFCKLFGLQALFPRSPLFARYNQSFRSEDETYMVDAVIGAFMFCRRDALQQVKGFDPDFFMYGEDLDLCFRMKQAGYATAYVPISSIIHYKGESTRRSSMNEVRVFYDAMEVFARKHYGSSRLFLLFLKMGIRLRSLIARAIVHKRSLAMMLCDILAVVTTFLLAIKLRRGDYFALPAYAFPTVFIALPGVVALCMIAVGEYFEYRPTVRRAATGLLLSFFVLSSLTYYWNEYAFSRGVLLMTIGFSLIALSVIRGVFALVDRWVGEESERRLILVGTRDDVVLAAEALRRERAARISFVGAVLTEDLGDQTLNGVKALGHIDYLARIIEQENVDEVVLLGEAHSASLIATMKSSAAGGIRFHVANDATNVVALGIAESISSRSGALEYYPILSFRIRVMRRVVDILGALLVLFILSPVLILVSSLRRRSWTTWWRNWWQVLVARKSIIGLYPPSGELDAVAKIGITGLAHMSAPDSLSARTIHELNEYYVRNYSLSLDLDIAIKSVFTQG